MAPSDPSDTVLAVCLRVRQSGALRVFVALRRIILDLWAAPPQCGYWGSMGSFCSAPQDFGLLGFFCARFPPREASYTLHLSREIRRFSRTNLVKIARTERGSQSLRFTTIEVHNH